MKDKLQQLQGLLANASGLLKDFQKHKKCQNCAEVYKRFSLTGFPDFKCQSACHDKDNLHKIGSHGAVFMVGKNGDMCVECGKEVRTNINPLRQLAMKRLEFLGLRDLKDKIQELINEINAIKNK